MNYDEMSDFEINKLVAIKIGRLVKTEFDEKHGFTERYHERYPSNVWTAPVDEDGHQSEAWEQSNYCNDPADAWPIIAENKISVIYNWQSDEFATVRGTKIEAKSLGPYYSPIEITIASPLRAAMIVFLMIKESE